VRPRRSSIESLAQSARLDAAGRRLQVLLARVYRHPAGKRAKDLLNGTWLKHPLHPALTDVPIGAWTTAAVCDLATLTGRKNLDAAASAAILVGVVGGAGAALAGIADWSDTGGGPRRIGLVHAGMNTAALGLQLASWWARRRGVRGARGVSLFGFGIAGAAAFLGGDLVYRRGVQVSRTAWHRGAPVFRPALAEIELADDQPRSVDVAGEQVMLVRHQGEIFALDDVCAHAGCLLSDGRAEAGTITCACHGSAYRLRDGAVVHGPSPFPQPTYDVQRVDGQVQVRWRRS
jgi:nitrite reductase/ring-hydroxylating ferredoxin subunit/uncharacterized membrane protein